MRWRRWLPTASERITEARWTMKADGFVTEHAWQIGQRDRTAVPSLGQSPADRPYDMRRLSYAGTFTNPFKAGTIRAIEWLTAKITASAPDPQVRTIGRPASARRSGPRRSATWASGIDTPPEEIARIPATGPLVVVANHPLGLVDGMIMAEMVNRVRSDFKILTRSLLTGIPEVAEFMIPVPFPHEDNARELGLQMRDETMEHLQGGRGDHPVPGRQGRDVRPAGGARRSRRSGTSSPTRWSNRSGATILPIYFPGQNSRAVPDRQPAVATPSGRACCCTRSSACLFKPQRPVIGAADPGRGAEAMGWQPARLPGLAARADAGSGTPRKALDRLCQASTFMVAVPRRALPARCAWAQSPPAASQSHRVGTGTSPR